MKCQTVLTIDKKNFKTNYDVSVQSFKKHASKTNRVIDHKAKDNRSANFEH